MLRLHVDTNRTGKYSVSNGSPLLLGIWPSFPRSSFFMYEMKISYFLTVGEKKVTHHQLKANVLNKRKGDKGQDFSLAVGVCNIHPT